MINAKLLFSLTSLYSTLRLFPSRQSLMTNSQASSQTMRQLVSRICSLVCLLVLVYRVYAESCLMYKKHTTCTYCCSAVPKAAPSSSMLFVPRSLPVLHCCQRATLIPASIVLGRGQWMHIILYDIVYYYCVMLLHWSKEWLLTSLNIDPPCKVTVLTCCGDSAQCNCNIEHCQTIVIILFNCTCTVLQ